MNMTMAQAEAHQRKHGFMEPQPHTCDAIKVLTKHQATRMNKTEAEYAMILEAMKRKGEILRYEYEGITLRWADMKYTPDFLVFANPWKELESLSTKIKDLSQVVEVHGTKLIEIKGGHIWDRDIVRFKGARAFYPEFQFEMHQKKAGQWSRIM